MGRIKAQAKSESKGIEHPQMTQMTQMKRQKAKAKTSGSRITPCHDDNIKAKDNNKTTPLDRG